MSERFPVCKAKEVVRVLRKHGFAMISQKGSHQKWRHANGRQSNCGLARQQTDPDWHIKKYHRGKRIGGGRFSMRVGARIYRYRRGDHRIFRMGRVTARSMERGKVRGDW